MHSLRTALPDNGKEFFLIEISQRRPTRPQRIRLISQRHMARLGVRIGIHSNGLYTQRLQGVDNADGDGASVCY